MNETDSVSDDSSRSLNRSGSNSHGLKPKISDFNIIKPISKGGFGKVMLCNSKKNPAKKLAVKIIRKSDVRMKNMQGQVVKGKPSNKKATRSLVNEYEKSF